MLTYSWLNFFDRGTSPLFEAPEAVLLPAPGLAEETFGALDFNFCIRSTPPRELNSAAKQPTDCLMVLNVHSNLVRLIRDGGGGGSFGKGTYEDLAQGET